MLNNEPASPKNVLDFKFFQLRKKAKQQELSTSFVPSTHIPTQKISKNINDIDISSRVKNIKESVQRINKLISELKDIANNPNK